MWVMDDHSTFPDVHYAVEDLISEGDEVVVRWTASGTQRAPFGPIPITSKLVTWSGIHIFLIKDGKLEKYWVEADSLGRLRQLGVQLTPPDPSP